MVSVNRGDLVTNGLIKNIFVYEITSSDIFSEVMMFLID